MMQRTCFFLCLVFLSLSAVGCGGPKAGKQPSLYAMGEPIRVSSADLAVRLMRISHQGDDETLIEDPGWSEFVLEIKNTSSTPFIVMNVKLLNQDGRYVDSAAVYEQIIAPPDPGTELAGDVAQTAAGIAAGQVIPYGGTLLGLLSGAASASSAGDRAQAKGIFMLRVLKNIELAPGGRMEGSAFLPNIAQPKTLIVDYVQHGVVNRLEIPLPLAAGA
jgi:hypothetical protein